MDHFWDFGADSREELCPATCAPFPSPKFTKRYIDAALTRANRKILARSFSPPDRYGNIVAAPPQWKTIDGRPRSPPPDWEPEEGWVPWTAEEIEHGKAVYRSIVGQPSTPAHSPPSSPSSPSSPRSLSSTTSKKTSGPSTGPSLGDETLAEEPQKTKTINEEVID